MKKSIVEDRHKFEDSIGTSFVLIDADLLLIWMNNFQLCFGFHLASCPVLPALLIILRGECRFYYDGISLEQVKEFKYLGTTFSASGSHQLPKEKLRKQADKAYFPMLKALHKIDFDAVPSLHLFEAYCILRKLRKLRIGCVSAQYIRKICARFSPNAQYLRNICARLYLFPQYAIYVQDLCKIVLISPMRNICTRFAQDCTYFPNAQYMRKICARLYFFLQCAIYAQDLCKIVLLSPMCNICARLYLFLQCAINAQDLHKIVPISPIRNIYARFAQDCTSFSNAQYMHKICTRLYLFLQCAIYVQDLCKIILISPM